MKELFKKAAKKKADDKNHSRDLEAAIHAASGGIAASMGIAGAMAMGSAASMGSVIVMAAVGGKNGPMAQAMKNVKEKAATARRTREEYEAIGRGEGIRDAIVVTGPLRFRQGNTASFMTM